ATYQRFPLVFTKGAGCTLWDVEGRAYTDFVAGIAVCNLGHAHPRIAQAVCRQAESLWHVSNLYYTVPQIELAEALTAKSFADRVFFCNSGAEANEAAIKLARRHFSEKGEKGRFRIVTMEHSFHGRTMATLSATGQDKIRKGFDPILDGFDFVPFNDLEALRQKLSPATCAVLLEPVQGEGGVRPADRHYLQAVRRLCDETGTLLIFDEIQTGMGRTGKLFAYEHFDIAPDIMTLAKALANGLPIGAMLAREEIASAFGAGSHGSTFGGTPLVTAAALEVLRIFEEEKILAHCCEIGAYFKTRLTELQQRHACVQEVRGLGLHLGLRLDREGKSIVQACMERGFLINCTQDTVLRFIPPLIVTRKEIDALVACLDELLG
ncbi:MAG: acetylornithine transaminase, partial [Desulfobacterales bacterium]|nr:acetylornithine transaminase [Desulfobacterales bacterium]